MKYPIITVTALNLLLAAAMPVMADDSDDHSGVDRGEEIKQKRIELRQKWRSMSPAERRSARENIRQRRESYRLQRR